jgi:hypothetical protein
MMLILGQYPNDNERVQQRLQQDVAGEMTLPQ